MYFSSCKVWGKAESSRLFVVVKKGKRPFVVFEVVQKMKLDHASSFQVLRVRMGLVSFSVDRASVVLCKNTV